jgi:molecular chaperone GrpE
MAQDPMTQNRPGSAPNDPDLDIPEIPVGIEGLTGDPVEQLVVKVEELEAAKADLNDKMLRALAETQNVRKRAQREIEDAGKYAVTRFARDMLSVADNLARALQALPAGRDQLDPSVRNTVIGVEATARELAAALERHGVAKVEALGKPFDPELHQAMMEVEDPSQPAGIVVQELVPGYTINGRLLRPAMVAVAKGGPTTTR